MRTMRAAEDLRIEFFVGPDFKNQEAAYADYSGG
jgi:hypothetical protein